MYLLTYLERQRERETETDGYRWHCVEALVLAVDNVQARQTVEHRVGHPMTSDTDSDNYHRC